MAGAQIARFPCSNSTGRRSGSGSSSQPTRQPVIDWYLLSDPTTTASRPDSQAECVGRPKLIPW